MRLQELVSSPKAMRAYLLLGRVTPDAIGHRLSWWIAGAICRLKPAVYYVVQANLGQVLPANSPRSVVKQTIRQVFYSAIRGYFDLFRAMRLSQQQLTVVVDLPQATRDIALSLGHDQRGTVLVSPHLGSFDLGGHAIVPLLPEMQLLTLPNPPPGFEMMNALRRRTGAQITPLNSSTLRQAIRLLQRGGVVGVGADRPVSELDEPVLFFNRLARVPSGHVRLALKTGARMVLAYCVLLPETGRYTMYLEPPMEMIHTRDRRDDVHLNMRRVLDGLERIISRWPGQWQMFVPVWPELVEP